MRVHEPRVALLLLLPCAVATLLIGARPASAGGGYVDDDGHVNLNVHFRFPPLAEDIDRVREQVQRASALMCDATEGQMRIASARLSAGGAGEPAGDVWYYPPGAINRSRSAGAPIHNSANRIYLQYESIRSDVLFHELGHLAFGLGDQYDEQRRAGDACGIGHAFDPGGLLDEANHTIMQQPSYQRCVTSGGLRTNRSCYDDADCETGETCPLPDLSSEFSVPTNNDPLRGDDALPADTCPANRAGDTYRVAGYLGENNAMTAFDPTDFDTAKSSSSRETAREYIDELGDVTAWDTGSAHPIWVFAEHVGAQAWTLHFAIDGKHLDGGTEGEIETLGSIDIEFEATPSVTVPIPGEADEQHRVLIRANGTLLSDPGYVPPTITIPELENGADSVELEIAFDGLEERVDWNGGDLAASEVTSGSFQQLGICGEVAACERRWNTTTQRWEASSTTASSLEDGVVPLSDWERLVTNMAENYELDWEMPAGLPLVDPLPGHDCDTPVEFDVAVEGLDQVYLVMDRSWSMSEERDWIGSIKSRMDWAKAGARGFADLMVDEGVDVGLISFNLDVTENLDLRILSQDGAGVPDAREISDAKAAIDGLNPNNNTAIGDALDRARQELAAAAGDGRTQAVMLLSDGEENGGVLDPNSVAESLRDDGVLVYTVPLGSDSDGELLGSIAETTGGETFDADSPDDLPPLYAQLWGRMRGEAPIWANVKSETVPINDNVSIAQHVVPVEAGSSRLNVMLSGRGEGEWDPICQLSSPSGATVVACDDATFVETDEFYKLIRVPNPEPGNWQLVVMGNQQPVQRSFIWAHSNNPGPDCWAGADPSFLSEEPSGGIMIRAASSYGAPLGRHVGYLIQVETPNGTLLPAEFMTLDERQNGAEYRFDDFQGRGAYEAVVTCLVTQDSVYSPGERADLVDILADEKPVAFLRQARTSFFLDAGDYPPPPPGDDCDDDGIPNTATPGGFEDDDKDGVQNYCDTDDDGDDVPDVDDRCPDLAETFTRGERIDGCPVPEPGIVAGLMVGLGGLAGAARRRREGSRGSAHSA